MNLQQLPKLAIHQDVCISVFFECFERLLDDRQELFEQKILREFRAELNRIKSSKPEMFKEFDNIIADFLKTQLDHVAQRLNTQRFAALANLEDTFQSFRALPVYDQILNKICKTDENVAEIGKNILIAGCGRCPEARWLLNTFQSSFLNFTDINDSDLKLLKESLLEMQCDSPERYMINHADLTRSSETSARPFDSFFFFHPLLIDFSEYGRLLKRFALEKDSKNRREILSQARLSQDAQLIFENLLNTLPSGGTGLISVVDGFEAHAMSNFLIKSGVTFSVESNPYALKKLSVIILSGMTQREAEQRTYHYIFRVKKP